jgi:hypothetical protein
MLIVRFDSVPVRRVRVSLPPEEGRCEYLNLEEIQVYSECQADDLCSVDGAGRCSMASSAVLTSGPEVEEIRGGEESSDATTDASTADDATSSTDDSGTTTNDNSAGGEVSGGDSSMSVFASGLFSRNGEGRRDLRGVRR